MAELPVLGNGEKFLVPSEKIARWVAGLGLLAVVITLGNYALPYVNTFLSSAIEAGFKTLVFGALAAIIGLIAIVALNPTFQTSVWYMVMGFIDKIALSVVKIDPIARVRSYISHYLKPMGVRLQELLDRAIGRELSAGKRLDDTRSQLATAMRRAEHLVDHGSNDGGRTWVDQKMRAEFTVVSQKITTLKPAIGRLEQRLKFQQGCVKVLQDLQVVVTSIIDVTEFNVQMMIEEYESAEEMSEGGREVRGMLGASKKTEFYNMAVQQIQDRTNQMMGEVQGVMSAVSKTIDAGKIDDAIGEEDLLRELTQRVGDMSSFAKKQKELTEGGEAVLLRDVKSRIIDAVPVERRSAKALDSSDSSDRFSKLLPPR